MFSDSDKPRQLSLNAFSWDSNNVSGKFQGCRTSLGFVARWEENIAGHLSQSGVFSQPMDLVSTDAAPPMSESMTSQSSESLADSQLSTPKTQKKRSAIYKSCYFDSSFKAGTPRAEFSQLQ